MGAWQLDIILANHLFSQMPHHSHPQAWTLLRGSPALEAATHYSILLGDILKDAKSIYMILIFKYSLIISQNLLNLI